MDFSLTSDASSAGLGSAVEREASGVIWVRMALLVDMVKARKSIIYRSLSDVLGLWHCPLLEDI